MEEAWEYIKAHESVTLSIDLFFIGIVSFFRSEQKVTAHTLPYVRWTLIYNVKNKMQPVITFNTKNNYFKA